MCLCFSRVLLALSQQHVEQEMVLVVKMRTWSSKQVEDPPPMEEAQHQQQHQEPQQQQQQRPLLMIKALAPLPAAHTLHTHTLRR
jgi:hypothetical protein